MRQVAYWNGRGLLEIVGAIDRDLRKPANRHIGELAVSVANEIDMVGNRTAGDRLERLERGFRIEHWDPSDVLQRDPDLLPIEACRDIGAERGFLFDAPGDLIGRSRDHDGFRREPLPP